jgi:AraC-like DNA-binding protein
LKQSCDHHASITLETIRPGAQTILTQTPNILTEPPDVSRDAGGRATPQDLVAETLATIRLSGAIFLRAEYSAPWAYESPAADELRAILRIRSRRIILFHIISEGQCWVHLPTGERLLASAGEVVILPYGHQHIMSSASAAHALPTRPIAIAEILPPQPWEEFPAIHYGGKGERTSVVCGYLHCDDPIFDPLIGALPPLFSVRPPDGPAAGWVAASIQYALDASRHGHLRSTGSSIRLPELLLSEVLRLYAENAARLQTGWLAALHDPIVGPALLELHADPRHKWTVEELARRVASSRSTLNERFGELLGRPPMQYLSEWRLQLAAGLLRTTSDSVAMVAYRVGYESEAAFNRAFKRAMGSPPAQWRHAQAPQAL